MATTLRQRPQPGRYDPLASAVDDLKKKGETDALAAAERGKGGESEQIKVQLTQADETARLDWIKTLTWAGCGQARCNSFHMDRLLIPPFFLLQNCSVALHYSPISRERLYTTQSSSAGGPVGASKAV